jgi:hypothetical protein
MPTDPVPEVISGYPYVVAAATNTGLTVQIMVYDDGLQAPGYMESLVQNLTDLLQDWPEKMPFSNARGSMYDVKVYTVQPTVLDNPPPPDPVVG